MRHWFAFFIVLCLSSSMALAQQAGVKPKVRFEGQSLELAFEGEDPGATIQEFIPAGQSLDSWTRLAAIRQFDDLNDPVEYGIDTIAQIKRDYPQSPSSLKEVPGTDIVILDFVLWPADGSFVEWNLFRYEKRPGGGLTSQQYAIRAYGDKSELFLKDLAPLRTRLIDEMTSEGLQVEGSASDSTAQVLSLP